LAIGKDGVIATLEGHHAISNEMMDVWRNDGDTFVRSWESRWVLGEGYSCLMKEALSALMKKRGVDPKGVTLAAFPGPDVRTHRRLAQDGRILTEDWDLYDTRHVVFTPKRMTPAQLVTGHRRAYRDAYRWSAIWEGAAGQDTRRARARHLAYAGGWKKFEPLWDLIIRSRHVNAMLPALERTLDAFVGARRPADRGSPALGSREVEDLLAAAENGFLGEVMNFPGVLAGDPEVMAKIHSALRRSKPSVIVSTTSISPRNPGRSRSGNGPGRRDPPSRARDQKPVASHRCR
jgi:hypothetical protein